MKKKKFYITTSIAYTNALPHAGFALELAQADVLARYYRGLGKDVFFLTGTDEHGKKVAKAAKEAGESPQEFTDKISSRFRALTKILNISNSDFIRTTDKKRHWPSVKKVWLKLKAKGDIYKKKYQGLYCVGCEAFIVKKDLKGGKCRIHLRFPEIVEEENYFFRLSKYSKKIGEILRSGKIKIAPQKRKNEMLSFVKQGLQDVSFSRPRVAETSSPLPPHFAPRKSAKDLSWGVPVPGDSKQTVYVWADALVNYISLLEHITKFKRYWPPDLHCLGKDIFKFHVLIWPGMILSLGLPLPKAMLVHGFITVGGQKMSKSLGNVVDPFELVRKYGADAVRYFLLREIPATEDGDFTHQKFEGRYNADLAGGLGNLVARVVALAGKLKMQNVKRKTTTQSLKLKIEISKTWRKYHKTLKEFKFNEALSAVWGLIASCDRYIEKEQPWKESKKQKEVIGHLLFVISQIAEMVKPFLPETAEKIFEQLKIKKRKPLFPRV
ncbi:MAG: methionyl-tRNA synthetase [Parcubacteria group bacterium Gr01-1014_30]|nr:MAG: methionyl-tRNA synthetase [Parcubacteria group bacterium Gr01-1014_30]